MNRIYLDHDLASRFGVSYYDKDRLIVALSTLRTAREWDQRHEEIWASHGGSDVVGHRDQADPPGWYKIECA